MAGSARQWRGMAVGEEPVVSVLFLVTETAVRWGKSAPAGAEGQEVRLAFHGYEPSDCFVQLVASVPGLVLTHAITLESASYRPDLPAFEGLRTGTIQRFARVAAVPAVDVLALFVAARDVKVGRNRLWHLRPALAEGMPEPIRKLLTYGRTGELGVQVR